MNHHHERWMIRNDGTGWYCAACGKRIANNQEDGTVTMLLAEAWQAGWDARANAAEWHPNPRPENPYLVRAQ